MPQVAGGAAWFSFQQLCRAVLGPADYQALAGRFHTVFITGIPALSLAVWRLPHDKIVHTALFAVIGGACLPNLRISMVTLQCDR